MLTTVRGTQPRPLMVEQVMRLIMELRAMDLQQQLTDEHGGRELAWYYWRGDVEEILGLDPGTLDMLDYAERFTGRDD